MVSNAKWAKGTTLTRGGSLIAELTNIDGPELSRDTIDVTSHDSANDYKEFIGGLKDGGEIALEGNFIPGDTNGQIGLQIDFEAGTVQSFVMTFPTAMATTWTFSGVVTKFKTSAPHDDKAKFSASIKVSGKPALGITISAGLTTPWLSANAGTLNPAAAALVYEWVLPEANGVASVILTPTAAAGTIVITCGASSQTVVSGQPSSAITIGAAGTVTEIVITVTETSKAPRTYKIYVSRAP